MKKLATLMILAISLSTFSCKNSTDKKSETMENGASESTQPTNSNTSDSANGFDINTIKISTAELGEFPYVKLPQGYVFSDPDHAQNGGGKGRSADLDKEYFLNDGVYFPMEGKTFKAHINIDRKMNDKSFAPLELQKSLDELIVGMGGVKINNGKGYKSGEKDRINELDPQAEPNGYVNSSQYYDNISTYVVRKPDYNVFIQYNLGGETGYITVLMAK